MPRTTTVHLLTGDYADRLSALWSAAQEAAKDETPLTAMESHPFEALKADYDALKAEALEAGTSVSLAAVGRKKWRELKEKHPARAQTDTVVKDGATIAGVDAETAKGDRLAGANTDSIEDDLVYESVKAWERESGETVDYARNRADFDDWADGLSEGEWQTLVTRAWELANGARLDPKELPPLPTRSDG